MQKNNLIDLVKSLSNLPGAPGFEAEVADFIEAYTQGFGQHTRDKMSNLYLSPQGNEFPLDACPHKRQDSDRLRIQLDAHMDEVALMVSAIRDNGMLEFITLGGWVSSNIPAHLLSVKTIDGSYVTGLSTSKPPHFMSEAERQAALKLEDIVIDVGTSSKEETLAMGIRVGAPIIPQATCQYDEKQGLFRGKAFDCRVGCAAMIATLDALKEQERSVDIIAAFSTQEEVGTRGAAVTANRVKADLAIVFEGCPADDTLTPAYKIQTAIKKGPMLRHYDVRMITHPGFQHYALEQAEKLAIPVQTGVRSGGYTNGALIHLANKGIPTIVIGIPVRYIHTSYGFMAYQDLEGAIKLATAIITQMNRATFDQL